MKNRVKFVILLFMFCACLPVLAKVPSSLLIQGSLTDSSNNPIADGTHTIKLSLYSAVTGGSSLLDLTQSVLVENGLFELNPTAVSNEALNYDNVRYMSLTVDGVELSPRLRIASNTYALLASKVSGETVTVTNNSGFGVTSIVSGTNSVGVKGRGYVYGVIGTCEVDSGEGAIGYASGSGGAGAYGKGWDNNNFGIMATNIAANTGSLTGAALNVDGKILVDREEGTFPKPAGTGTISAGNSSVTITNSLASNNSIILLTVYDGSTSSSNANGGIKISSITEDTEFVVKTMDGNNVAAGAQISFCYLIINN